MATKRRATVPAPSPRCYRGADVPMRVIRRFARQVAERFRPDKIFLFGSHAYGTPHADSDVDILVVMPCRNQLDQAFKIRSDVPAIFPIDLIVRTPKDMQARLADGDLFHTKIVTRGKLLYSLGPRSADRPAPPAMGAAGHLKRATREWADRAEGQLRASRRLFRASNPPLDHVCFHCRQSAENCLKALLEQRGRDVEKTVRLEKLLTPLLDLYPRLRPLRRGLVQLSPFTLDILYPGKWATRPQAVAALRWAGRVRDACRAILGVPPPRGRKRPP